MKRVRDTENALFSSEELIGYDNFKAPRHVAFVMDGNRRWAQKHTHSPVEGHQEGGKALMRVTHAAALLGVEVVTGYAFSTENWGRSQEEVDALMHIFVDYLKNERETMKAQGVSLRHIGDISTFPEYVLRELMLSEQETCHCSCITLVLALNYGGRDDICRAVRKLVAESADERISANDITEEKLSRYLDTSLWGDPDLLIRTSGEMRISNFLLWQISYAEIYFTDVLWPDFGPHHLLSALKEYQRRERRYGE